MIRLRDKENSTGISVPSLISKVGLAILIVIALMGVRTTDTGQLSFFGYRPVVVVSGSMLPSIQINSISILHECDFNSIEVGDVIMYYNPYREINITHRVVDIQYNADGNAESFVTRGDANDTSDGIAVTPDLFRGELVRTFNSVAPIVSLAVENQQLNHTVVLLVILILALIIATIYAMIAWVISIIYTLLLSVGVIKSDKISKQALASANVYRQLASNPDKLIIQGSDKLRVKLAKFLVMRQLINLKTFADEAKDCYKEIDKGKHSS